MPSDFSSRQIVNLIQIDNRQIKKDQNQEEWIRQLKDWRLNGTECSNPTAKVLTKDYLSKMFFIEDNILWVRIQTKGEPTQVCVVLPQNRIQEVLKDKHGALFNGHEGVAKTRFNLTKKYCWPCMTGTLQNFFEIVELVRRPSSAGMPPTCLLLHRFVQKPINECTWT